MEPAEIRKILEIIAMCDIANFYDEWAEPKPLGDLSEEQRACIRRVRATPRKQGSTVVYTVEFEFYDRLAALKELAAVQVGGKSKIPRGFGDKFEDKWLAVVGKDNTEG